MCEWELFSSLFAKGGGGIISLRVISEGYLPDGAAMAFTEIPILDLFEASREDTKPKFLRKLRNVLLNFGFFYIQNTGIDQELYDRVCEEGIKFFGLPDEEKMRIEMKNQKSFLGYSRVGSIGWTVISTGLRLTREMPVGQRDHRTQGRLARTA